MELSTPEPADLVRRIRAGDRKAEDDLVRRYSRGVSFVIHQGVSDTSYAEDIYQESFRLVIEKIRAGEVREPERLSGFVCSLARNLVVEQYRRISRRREDSSDLEQPIPNPEPNQLDRLLRDEKRELVRKVLAALPSDRDRKVLQRFYLADDDKEEICKELGITSLHFNQVLCRARERYRKLFEEMNES